MAVFEQVDVPLDAFDEVPDPVHRERVCHADG